jgi:hypothetical protein
VKKMVVHQGIHLLHILQEVRSIGKTCNQLDMTIYKVFAKWTDDGSLCVTFPLKWIQGRFW